MTNQPLMSSPVPPHPHDDTPETFGPAVRRALASSGGVAGILITAAPTVAFVAVNSLANLWAALIALAVTAVGAFAMRVARHESLKGAVAGLVLAGTCAGVAALTGEARGFFLLPTLLPAAIMLVCLGSVLLRRPVTGILLNRLAGGPTDWRTNRGLMHIYTVSTLVAVGVNIVNFVIQATFYLADQPAALAVAHVATGPVFACLVAVTVIAVRRYLHRASRA